MMIADAEVTDVVESLLKAVEKGFETSAGDHEFLVPRVSFRRKDGAPEPGFQEYRETGEYEDSDSDNSMIYFSDVPTDDDDSDAEFEKILAAVSLHNRRNKQKEWGDKQPKRRKVQPRNFVPEKEYENLPPIENLHISVDSQTKLLLLGTVKTVVEGGTNAPAVDVDTVVFSYCRNAIGQIFDVFGQVREPMYSIRFNSPEEAAALALDTKLFVAASDNLTKTVFVEQLEKERHVDDCWDGTGDCPDEEMAFSDDEAENIFKTNKRSKGRRDMTNGVSNEPSAPSSSSSFWARGRGGMGEQRGRGGRGRGGRGRGACGGAFRPDTMSWPPRGGAPQRFPTRGFRGHPPNPFRRPQGWQAAEQGAPQEDNMMFVDTRYFGQ